MPAVAVLWRPAVADRLAVGLHQAIGYKLAYGTEKHEEYYDEMHEKLRSGELVRESAWQREELEAMEAKGALPPKLRGLKTSWRA